MDDTTRYTGEIARLEAGLLARGMDITGPPQTAPVTCALAAIDALLGLGKRQTTAERHAQMERFLDMHGHTQPAHVRITDVDDAGVAHYVYDPHNDPTEPTEP